MKLEDKDLTPEEREIRDKALANLAKAFQGLESTAKSITLGMNGIRDTLGVIVKDVEDKDDDDTDSVEDNG